MEALPCKARIPCLPPNHLEPSLLVLGLGVALHPRCTYKQNYRYAVQHWRTAELSGPANRMDFAALLLPLFAPLATFALGPARLFATRPQLLAVAFRCFPWLFWSGASSTSGTKGTQNVVEYL